MIKKDNYYSKIKNIDFTMLDASLQESKEFVDEITQNGSSWDLVYQDDDIKEMVHLYFETLEKAIAKVETKKGSSTSTPRNTKKLKAIQTFIKTLSKEQLGSDYAYVFSADMDRVIARITHSKASYEKHLNDFAEKLLADPKYYDNLYAKNEAYSDYFSNKKKTVRPSRSVRKSTPKKKTARQIAYEKANKVEALSIELKMIKRFTLMHDKLKSQNQIRLFINALQKAIVEKRIRKTSDYAKEITEIQNFLIKLYGRFESVDDKVHVIIGERKRSHYLTLIGKQAELISVKFIKSYINLQGKSISNGQAKRLYNRIASAINGNKLSKKDRYWEEIERILSTLKSFIKKNHEQGELIINSKELNGLENILLGCACNPLDGLDTAPKNTIMSSVDIVQLSFNKIGFSGKWKKLIGDPSSGFTAMIFGKPKMGKSYLAVDFSGYLARNHGTVLYVAKEEGIDDTLQAKLKDKNVAHPDLYVSDYLPSDLSAYDFVFLDSVNKLNLLPEDLEDLKRKFPSTSFIYIFQTTKQGNFRGGNEFQHNVDVVIEVPEKGKAVQYGRFNQGGEINIFSS